MAIPLLVFDTETVPDGELHSGDEFPKAPFNRVVAISFLSARLDVAGDVASYAIDELRTGGDVSYSEGQLIRAFFQYIEKTKPRLVTFNGRGFDLPVLKYRGLKYECIAPWFARGDGRWDNYGYRYSVDWHCDLMDALSDFGASKIASLGEVCGLLGVPGKIGIDGSQVRDLVASGRLTDVRNYCETDVLSTYLIFLRFALFRGEIDARGFATSIASLRTYLSVEMNLRPHLGLFLQTWQSLQVQSL